MLSPFFAELDVMAILIVCSFAAFRFVEGHWSARIIEEARSRE
jgi:hypothetical protein